MLEKEYEKLKEQYNKYIILIKNGNFYLSFNNDAIIINKILKYKIKETKKGIKTGFPILSLNKVLEQLNKLKINYLLLENNEIVLKKKYANNNYDKYINNKYNIISKRIKNIFDILSNNLSNKNIDLIINDIEEILCKIDL